MIRCVPASGGRIFASAFAALTLAACATPGGGPLSGEGTRPHYKVGQAYQVNGRWYYPREQPDYNEVGVASWYGDEFDGRPTANGERFDKNRLSAAHTTLPLPSVVEVENLENGRRAVIRVNDRGPFVGDRLIDLSHAAARELGFEQKGLARVRVRYLGRAELAALAPRPGQKAQPLADKPTPMSATIERAPNPAPPKTGSGKGEFSPESPDIIAQLIGEADATASAGSTQPLKPAPPPEIWIDVRQFLDLADLDIAQLSVSAMGPARVRSMTSGQGQPAYLLQLGPYKDALAAEARLAALREAGYAEARISDGSF
ncbi:MAG: septal ring lytic transglycosylase RlpA family protein [Pseudomonadota bacterium]|nr:septal ring lytic transglycosylase RlpA family protein [Pseudomonadota bacterium]